MTTKAGAETITVDESSTEPINLDKMIGQWDKDGSFKAQVSKRYKQFYHKTDKVRCPKLHRQHHSGLLGSHRNQALC